MYTCEILFGRIQVSPVEDDSRILVLDINLVLTFCKFPV